MNRLLSRLPQHGPRSASRRYALVVVIVFVATALRAAADPWVHNQIPYFIYIAAVVVTTWWCGIAGGVFATIMSAFVGNYLFVLPRYEFWPHGEDWIAMTLFAAVSLFLVAQVGRWRSAEGELQEEHRRVTALHQEAERMNRLKDEFLATLSHELRTPLNAVTGWAHLLMDGKLPQDKQHEALAAVLRNARAQTRLVEDILDISRIISGRMQLHLIAVDVSRLVQRSVDTVRPAADAKQITVDSELAPDVIVAADQDRLEQIAWNLLSNAVKFTPKGGRVSVRTAVRESALVLTVSDTGVGIDPAFLPHVFQRFTQADSSTTRSHGGLGVGLAIVRHLAELHGGTVSVESAGRDRGATFGVTLPIRAVIDNLEPATRDEDRLSPEPAEAPRLDGLRLLVVDDEPDARQLVHTALSRLGAEVRTVASAAEAFAVVQFWRPDVLVADIGMPQEDGYSLIRRIRGLPLASGGNVPAIALTAYAQEADRQRAHAAGYQAHVAKPVAPSQLARVVAETARAN